MHQENCLVCSVNTVTARLENWTYYEGGVWVHGEVYDDIHHRWRNGTIITTSKIVNLDIENGHVRTLNSLYVLGKRKVL